MKEKPSLGMFAKGGLSLLVLGGFFGVFYQALYLLIALEVRIGDISTEVPYTLFITIFKELGILFVFAALIFLCFFFLKEKEFFQKHAGSTLIAGSVLSLPAVFYALYDIVTALRDQTVTARNFAVTTFPQLMGNICKVYIFVGAVLLGVYLWNRRGVRKWAAAFFLGGATAGCITFGASVYTSYDSYIFLMGMYGEASKDVLITQFLFPDLLRVVSWLLIVIGVLLLSAFYVKKKSVFKKWGGRTWVFGGIAAAFYGFIRLGMESRNIHNEITSVRRSIMELTPYSTSLKDLMLTIETLREFYVKKMLPVYMENSLWIAVFAGIAVLGIYLWVRE